MTKPSLVWLTTCTREGSPKITWEDEQTHSTFRLPEFTKTPRPTVDRSMRRSRLNHARQCHSKQARYLSIEQQRRRRGGSLPQEHYELAVVRHQLADRESGKVVPCRAVFVFSTADQKVARKNREKSIHKLRQGLEKIARSVAEGRRNTDPTSIARRVSRLFGKLLTPELREDVRGIVSSFG